MVLTFHVPIFEIFLEDKKGIGDVASLRLSLHGVILSPGGPPSPKFSRVPLVDVFVTICFFFGKWLLALCPTLLFSQPGLGPSMAEFNPNLAQLFLLILLPSGIISINHAASCMRGVIEKCVTSSCNSLGHNIAHFLLIYNGTISPGSHSSGSVSCLVQMFGSLLCRSMCMAPSSPAVNYHRSHLDRLRHHPPSNLNSFIAACFVPLFI